MHISCSAWEGNILVGACQKALSAIIVVTYGASFHGLSMTVTSRHFCDPDDQSMHTHPVSLNYILILSHLQLHTKRFLHCRCSELCVCHIEAWMSVHDSGAVWPVLYFVNLIYLYELTIVLFQMLYPSRIWISRWNICEKIWVWALYKITK